MLGLGAYGSSSEDEGPDTHSSRLQKLKEIEKKVSQDLEYLDANPTYPEILPEADRTIEHSSELLVGPFQPSHRNSSANRLASASPKTSPFSSTQTLIRNMTLPPLPNLDIPPSPPGSPNPVANQKFAHFLSLKKQGVHFNEKLAGSSSLRNPSLLAKLMTHSGIDEHAQYATSLPQDIWDVSSLPHWGYKEQLVKSQQEIRRKIEEKKSSGHREFIDFVPCNLSRESSRTGTPSSGKMRSSAAERVMAGLDREKTRSPMGAEQSRRADLERRPRRSELTHKGHASRSPSRRQRSRSQ